MKKKVLSVLLTLAMVLSLLPVTALADTDVTSAELQSLTVGGTSISKFTGDGVGTSDKPYTADVTAQDTVHKFEDVELALTSTHDTATLYYKTASTATISSDGDITQQIEEISSGDLISQKLSPSTLSTDNHYLLLKFVTDGSETNKFYALNVSLDATKVPVFQSETVTADDGNKTATFTVTNNANQG